MEHNDGRLCSQLPERAEVVRGKGLRQSPLRGVHGQDESRDRPVLGVGPEELHHGRARLQAQAGYGAAPPYRHALRGG
ncbi:hypothetical protein ACGU38_29815, partial [Streptomyces rochei]